MLESNYIGMVKGFMTLLVSVRNLRFTNEAIHLRSTAVDHHVRARYIAAKPAGQEASNPADLLG